MKKSVMILLVLAGLTEIGVIQGMDDITAGQAKSSVCSGCEANYGNSGAVFSNIASNQPFMVIKKTLKGYSSMKRSSYLSELMQLV